MSKNIGFKPELSDLRTRTAGCEDLSQVPETGECVQTGHPRGKDDIFKLIFGVIFLILIFSV